MLANRPEDRLSYLCSFTFADGRRCRTPRSSAPPFPLLCPAHARREAQRLAAEQVGLNISRRLSGKYNTACDLSAVLAQLFSATAQGQVDPKTATALAYLGQTLLHAIHVSQDEFIKAYSPELWHRTVRAAVERPAAPGALIEVQPAADSLPESLTESNLDLETK